MSFVVFVGNQDFGLMLADKRAISYDGKIEDENANKIIRVNSNAVICTSGDVSIKQYVLKGLSNLTNIEHLSFDDVKYIIYKKLEEINSYIRLKKYKGMKSSIGIMGIKDNNIHFISLYISYDEIKTEEKIYSDGDNGYCVVANGTTQLEKIFYKKLMDNVPCSMNDIIRIFSEILHEQSDKDISINASFDYEYIKNDRNN